MKHHKKFWVAFPLYSYVLRSWHFIWWVISIHYITYKSNHFFFFEREKVWWAMVNSLILLFEDYMIKSCPFIRTWDARLKLYFIFITWYFSSPQSPKIKEEIRSLYHSLWAFKVEEENLNQVRWEVYRFHIT